MIAFVSCRCRVGDFHPRNPLRLLFVPSRPAVLHPAVKRRLGNAELVRQLANRVTPLMSRQNGCLEESPVSGILDDLLKNFEVQPSPGAYKNANFVPFGGTGCTM